MRKAPANFRMHPSPRSMFGWFLSILCAGRVMRGVRRLRGVRYSLKRMDQADSYKSSWAAFRQRRRRFFLSGAAAFAILVVGAKITVTIGSSGPIIVAVILAVSLTAIFGIPYVEWPCPRCKNAFLSKGPVGLIYRNPFAQQCIHCKFVVGEHSDTRVIEPKGMDNSNIS